MKRLIGLILIVIVVAFTTSMSGGNPLMFINLNPVMPVLGITLGLTIMYYKQEISMQDLLKRIKKYLVSSGYIGFIIQVVSIIVNLQSLNINSIGPSLPLALITIFYGYIFASIVDTFIHE